VRSRLSPPWVILAALALLVGAAFAVLVVQGLTEDEDGSAAPAPQVVEEGAEQEEEASEELGFPAFATKNTTRVAGNDAAAVAAGVALATHPSQGGIEGPPAVVMVPDDDWASALAASPLVGDPIGAAVLVSGPDGVPDETSTALLALDPQGSSDTNDAQLFTVGDAAAPGGLRTTDVEGANPAEVAVAVDELRQRLTDSEPEHIVLVSSDAPAYAMPAAAWAARSGDPVLFVQRDSVPTPTLDALERHKDTPVFLLGPPSAASERVLREVERAAPSVERIFGDDAVSSSIAFARFADGDFGWSITDPGHGLVIANESRPLDATAAAPLSASGKWGPLLVTDSADVVPAALRGFLLDIKPGFVADPTRAFYNHAWLIGDGQALSVGFQAQVDELLELTRIREGTGNFGDQSQPEQEEERP
jgi:putative cell wall-binding protein